MADRPHQNEAAPVTGPAVVFPGNAIITKKLENLPERRHYNSVINQGAYILRENTGTSGIERTLRDAVSILAHFDIPHLVVGGLAVQEHGYFRVTLDADVVVPDVLGAVEYVTADVSGPFVRHLKCEDTVQDKRNGVVIHFLPAGRVLRRGNKVPFPDPGETQDNPQFVSLEDLISLKLDSWSGSPNRRHKDKTDVIELIKVLKLSRELKIQASVQKLYEETWDALRAED